jgi:hypothetical protein
MFRPLIFVALLTGSAQAAKPPPPAGTHAPEVIYTLAGRRGYELRVANEDGTGAVTLFQGPQLVIGKFGPRADRTIVFMHANQLILMTYAASSAGVVEESREILLDIGRRFSGSFDFSGTDVAWWHPGTGELRIYNLPTKTDRLLANVPDLAGVSFSADHTKVFYGDGKFTGQYSLYSIPANGGDPTELGIGTKAAVFDSGRTADHFVMAYPISGNWQLDFVPAGANSGERIAKGIEGSFRCDDKVIIYRVPMTNNGYDTLIYDLEAKLSTIFSTHNDVKFASYMPDCAESP